MQGVSVLLLLGIATGWTGGQFLNNKPFPTYSLENMPNTEFSCRDKILGGYYADAETQCQMFHICVKVAGVGIQDFRFLCPNGTAFDQDHQICADWEDVDCDATTLYYSSDNFDLYRIGSGYESKARKYGEDEETFALQRAETGDARINKEHQSNSINQKKELNLYKTNQKNVYNSNNKNNNNNDRDIFKGSSSSNFFNNKNNGKERDEDYDDNVNVNQDREYEPRRKVIRTRQRVQNKDQNNNSENQNRNNNQGTNSKQNQNRNDYSERENRNIDNSQRNNNSQNQNRHNNNNQRQGHRKSNQNSYNQEPEQENVEIQTRRPQRPTGFVNNFAGSSYIPTTSRPTIFTTITDEQYTTAINNHKTRTGQRISNPSTPSYTVSTPAPFRNTQQYNLPPNRQSTFNNGQYYTTTQAPKEAENYPSQKKKLTTAYNDQYDTPKIQDKYVDVPKVKQTENLSLKATTFGKTENYPSNNPQYLEKKQTTPLKKTESYPTTLAPKPKPFSVTNGLPSTFVTKTTAGYTQIAQQTVNYNKPFSANGNTQYQNPTTFDQHYNNPTKSSTPRSTPFTQYTPTVPKIASTTPVSRSGRFDETQYDDGSYNNKYDYDSDKREDEFLKTAHSQNIAASRNEYTKTTKQSTQKPSNYESPRPFSVSPNTPRLADYSKVTTLRPAFPKQIDNFKVSTPAIKKSTKTKNASYDYSYYDTNVGSEPDYDVDIEFKKSTIKN